MKNRNALVINGVPVITEDPPVDAVEAVEITTITDPNHVFLDTETGEIETGEPLGEDVDLSTFSDGAEEEGDEVED